jgi:DNA-binding CsgD family transcriptional regulator/N-acetylneuraminic acid mutarotase
VLDNETNNPLSKRELQVLELVATGASNQQIAQQLVISVNTVKVHLRNIFEKLNVQSRTEATLRAIQEGWISVADNSANDSAEEEPGSPRTYLLPPGMAATLSTWQQWYLVAAVILTLAVLVIPTIPKDNPRETPNLPVIYAQPPTPAAVNTDSGSWLLQSPMPSKRAGLGTVTFDGKMYAIGGMRSNNKATRLVEIYNPDQNSWAEGAAKPSAAANVVAVTFEDKIYVPGGCTNQGQAITALDIYVPQSDSWAEGPALPEARCGYGLVSFHDKLYLFGGWNGVDFTDTIFIFDVGQNTWVKMSTTMPVPMGYMGVAVLNDSIYVAGGYNGRDEFNQTWIFEPDNGQWQEKAPMLEKRGGLGLINAAGNLYAIGGGWNQSVSNSEKYTPATDTWAAFAPPATHQWRNMGLSTIDTKIYAIGGWNSTDEQFVDSVMSYQFLFQLFLPISSFGE